MNIETILSFLNFQTITLLIIILIFSLFAIICSVILWKNSQKNPQGVWNELKKILKLDKKKETETKPVVTHSSFNFNELNENMGKAKEETVFFNPITPNLDEKKKRKEPQPPPIDNSWDILAQPTPTTITPVGEPQKTNNPYLNDLFGEDNNTTPTKQREALRRPRRPQKPIPPQQFENQTTLPPKL